MTLLRLRISLGIFLFFSLLYFGRLDINILQGGDTQGYYLYLPAAFIHGDLDSVWASYNKRFDYAMAPPDVVEPGHMLTVAENGKHVIKYTSGVAILQLPFFWIGHGMATILPGVEADGYTWPYLFCINISVLFWFWLGIGWLWHALRRDYSPLVAGSVIILLAVGTNLYNFLIYRGVMAHGYLFSLYAGLIWATIRFYDKPTFSRAAWIGLSAGFITMIRPVEVICLFIPLLYGLSSWKCVGERFKTWKTHFSKLVLAIAVFAAVGFIQLLYWKYSSGEWFFFSYGEEKFYWDKSKINRGILSYRNGWLRYSPLMILSLVGIFYLWFKHRKWFWPVIVFLPIHIYITYAWWNWYYINGFGSRPMVETYALLAFPMGALFSWSTNKTWANYMLISFVTACVGLNLFQHEQHRRGILFPEEENTAHYWEVFGSLDHTEDAIYAFFGEMRRVDESKLTSGVSRYYNDFEELEGPDSSSVQPEIVFGGQGALKLEPHQIYKLPTLEAEDIAHNDYLRIKAKVRKESPETPWWEGSLLVAEGNWHKGRRKLFLDGLIGNENYSIFHSGNARQWQGIDWRIEIPSDFQFRDERGKRVDNPPAEVL
ncbi:MAG: hypothetical protein AAFY36_13990, partial [Bacteroidota bacterium]